MSSAEANRVITMHLHRLLEQSPAYRALKDNTVRETLNNKYHIIDMSKVSLSGNIDNDTSRTSKAYDTSYPILIKTIIFSLCGIAHREAGSTISLRQSPMGEFLG